MAADQHRKPAKPGATAYEQVKNEMLRETPDLPRESNYVSLRGYSTIASEIQDYVVAGLDTS